MPKRNQPDPAHSKPSKAGDTGVNAPGAEPLKQGVESGSAGASDAPTAGPTEAVRAAASEEDAVPAPAEEKAAAGGEPTIALAPDPAPLSPPSTPPSLYALLKAGDEGAAKRLVVQKIRELVTKHGLDSYEIVFLFDDLDSITEFHSDNVYSALGASAEPRDILLIAHSRGGRIEPAFLISKTCKKLAREKFVIAVPRRAKSAATLIALGADEIHMGMMSQLGPIDPQINGYPALGLANGLNKISELVCNYPKSGEMWSKYLSENLSLRQLGHLERLGESAAQYAERLLHGRTLPLGQTAKTLGDHFVNHYKDHSFVIDTDEATQLLGPGIVKTSTAEYSFANEAYQELSMFEFLLRYVLNKEFYFVGRLDPDAVFVRDRPKDN